MEINWTPEVLANGLAALLMFIAVILVFTLSKRKKLKSLLYFRLVFFFIALYSLFEAISDLFLFKPIAITGVMMLYPTAVFAIIAINYVVKDTYFSFTLLFLIAVGPVLLLLSVDLNSFVLHTGEPYTYISSTQWPLFTELFFTTFFGFAIFYWALRTYLNAPFLIKKDALVFLIGVFLGGVIAIILNIFIIFSRIFVIIALAFADIGALIILYMVEREPKLFYILPFVVHRILVKDNKGFPLYDHDWSKSDIDEVLFSGFINAVQHMSNEIMDIGGLLDINLERGILILHHSKHITVGLVATKSSKLLRDSLMKFTKDFEKKFARKLKQSINEMNEYRTAYELIEKYFSNFPYRIFKNTKQPFLLSGKFIKFPKELDNKIKNKFPNQEEYEFIKSELIKAPPGTFQEFEKLYNELDEELKKLSGEEKEFLDSAIEK